MSSAIFHPFFPSFAGSILIPTERGPMTPCNGAVLANQRLPEDAIGTITLTFSGVAAGSEIRIYDAALTEIAGVESCDANHALTVPYYAAGSSSNNVTIRIIPASYEVIELPYTIPQASASIPIQHRRDRWYSNPA